MGKPQHAGERLSIEDASTPEQLDAARTLFREYNSFLGIDLGFQSFEDELGGLPGAYAPPGGCLLLAYWEDALVGCVALKALPEDESGIATAEMKRLFVRKGFGRNGIGRALLEEIIKRAKSGGYRRLRLDSLRRLEGAARLYSTLPIREIPPYNDNPHDDVYYMELNLAECG